MPDDVTFKTGEWVEAVETIGNLEKGKRYYVWMADAANGIARLSTQFGGAYSLSGSFTFGYLERSVRKVK